MEGITVDSELTDFVEKGVQFSTCPCFITMERDLLALKDNPDQDKAVVHLSSKTWVSEIEVDMRCKSSIKALIGVNFAVGDGKIIGSSATHVYSMITLIATRKRIMDTVHPMKIPRL